MKRFKDLVEALDHSKYLPINSEEQILVEKPKTEPICERVSKEISEATEEFYKTMKKPSLFTRIKRIWKLFNMFNYECKGKTNIQKIKYALKNPRTTAELFKQAIDLEKMFLWRDAEEIVASKQLKATPQEEIDARNLPTPGIVNKTPNEDGDHIDALNRKRCKIERNKLFNTPNYNKIFEIKLVNNGTN